MTPLDNASAILVSLGVSRFAAGKTALMLLELARRQSNGLAVASMSDLGAAAGIGRTVAWQLRPELLKAVSIEAAPRGGRRDGTIWKLFPQVLNAISAQCPDASGQVERQTGQESGNPMSAPMSGRVRTDGGVGGVRSTTLPENEIFAAAASFSKTNENEETPRATPAQCPDASGQVERVDRELLSLRTELNRLSSLVVALQGGMQALAALKGMPANAATAAISDQLKAELDRATTERWKQATSPESTEVVRERGAWSNVVRRQLLAQALAGDRYELDNLLRDARWREKAPEREAAAEAARIEREADQQKELARIRALPSRYSPDYVPRPRAVQA